MAITYTVVLVHETDADAFVASVPMLDLVTYGATKQEALEAAREAIELDLIGRVKHHEAVPIEPDGYASIGEVTLDRVPLDGVVGIGGEAEDIERELANVIAEAGTISHLTEGSA